MTDTQNTQQNRRYLRVGLTGGIGSGKSTVATRLRELGAFLYDADEIARASLRPDGACFSEAVEAFGDGILSASGEIDRAALAQIIFSDDTQREKLNDIVHPYVMESLFSSAKHDLTGKPGAIAVFDVPLLFESGMHRSMDLNVLVLCDEETRVLRIMERDGSTRAQARARVRAQMPDHEKQALADIVLDNNDTQEELILRTDALFDVLNLLADERGGKHA